MLKIYQLNQKNILYLQIKIISDLLHKDYRDKKAIFDLEEVSKNNGKCYLYIDDDKVLGLIIGIERKYEEEDYLDYKCPKQGIITELIVTSKIRSKGIGKKLINHMEDYFKSIGCDYILVDVFAYNEVGKNFYESNGYHSRMITEIKRIGDNHE